MWIKNELYEVVYQRVIDEPNDIGYCDDKKKILYIKLDLEHFDELDVFLHEYLHALSFLYKIRISHKTLDKLGTALAESLIANKWVKK